MKCKICGHRTNKLYAMGEHYRKKHPKSLKRGVSKYKSVVNPTERRLRALEEQVFG